MGQVFADEVRAPSPLMVPNLELIQTYYLHGHLQELTNGQWLNPAVGVSPPSLSLTHTHTLPNLARLLCHTVIPEASGSQVENQLYVFHVQVHTNKQTESQTHTCSHTHQHTATHTSCHFSQPYQQRLSTTSALNNTHTSHMR